MEGWIRTKQAELNEILAKQVSGTKAHEFASWVSVVRGIIKMVQAQGKVIKVQADRMEVALKKLRKMVR